MSVDLFMLDVFAVKNTKVWGKVDEEVRGKR